MIKSCLYFSGFFLTTRIQAQNPAEHVHVNIGEYGKNFNKYIMKRISMMPVAITCSFISAGLYCFMLISSQMLQFIFPLLLVCEFNVVWVVYSILKDKNPPQRSFDEYLYLDSDKKWVK